jgi:TonB family protein
MERQYRTTHSEAEMIELTEQGWEFVSTASDASGEGYLLRSRKVGSAAVVRTEPILVSKVEPDFTPEARAKGIEGSVRLYAEINQSGQAVNVRVIGALDPGLDANAVEAVRKWRFRPALRDGKPVTVAATFDVVYRAPKLPAPDDDRPGKPWPPVVNGGFDPLSILIPRF